MFKYLIIILSLCLSSFSNAENNLKPVSYYSGTVVNTENEIKEFEDIPYILEKTMQYEVIWFTTFKKLPPIYTDLKDIHTRLVTNALKDCLFNYVNSLQREEKCSPLFLGDIGFGIHIQKIFLTGYTTKLIKSK